jgi:hypothetical protein
VEQQHKEQILQVYLLLQLVVDMAVKTAELEDLVDQAVVDQVLVL